MTLPERRSNRLRPRWPVAAGLVLAVAVAAWSGLWLLASNRAGAAFDEWLAAEQRSGRQWTCPDRRIDGYPFRLRVGCGRPTFRGEIAGRTASGIVEGLRAEVSLGHPGVVAVDLKGPMNLRAEDDEFDLMVSWEDLRLTLPTLPSAPRQGALDATRLAVTLSAPAKGVFNLRAARLAGEAEPAASATDGIAFRFTAAGASLPTLDDFMGSGEPIEADGRGVLTRADLLTAPTVKRLEAWRSAGGTLRIAALSLGKGPFQGRFTGQLQLDAEHRMAGRLDTELSGFEPLAARFGIPLAGVKLGGLLTSLLGGKKAASSPAGAVQLPLVFEDGHLSVGPFETPLRIDPLY